jgi:hypothetical protein
MCHNPPGDATRLGSSDSRLMALGGKMKSTKNTESFSGGVRFADFTELV